MNQNNQTSRRSVLKSGALVAGGVALSGCLGGGKSDFQKELEAVRTATSDYTDPQAAYDAGYVVAGKNGPLALNEVTEKGHAICGMGYHFGKRELFGSTDKTKPAVLVYGVDSAGDFVLGGVEYLVQKKQGYQNAPPDIFDHDGGDEESAWAEDSPTEGMWALHAWVHSENEEGIFHPTNPADAFHPEGCQEIPDSH